MLEDLVEVDRAEDKEAANFRAKLLGLIYEGLLEEWFKSEGYRILGRDVRKGTYEDKKFPVDFLLEKNGKLYVVEAKCWPSYNEGKLKKLGINTLRNLRRRSGTHRLKLFLGKEFLDRYQLGDKKVDFKVLAWWDVEDSEVEEIKQETGLCCVIPIKRVLEEGAETFREKLDKYREWAEGLFEAIRGDKLH